MLDDYDVHRSKHPCKQLRTPSSFTPRFDVRELDDGYHLDGELPGVEQDNIDLEFTDPHTLVIKGRSERNYTDANSTAQAKGKSRQPTVEDDGDNASTSDSSTESFAEVDDGNKSSDPVHKYLVSERPTGEFHRSFAFPSRIDQDAVKARLRNGVLSVVVPREAAPRVKKIRVE